MRAEPPSPRAFVLQNGLRSGSSHFLQETEGWIFNLEEQGFIVLPHGNAAFGGGKVAGLPVEPSFTISPDSTIQAPPLFQKLRTFVEGHAMFARDCGALDAADPAGGDLILIPYATAVEMMGLARWLNRRKTAGKAVPFVVPLLHRPDYDWQWDARSGRLTGDLAPFAYACHTLKGVCGRRLALLTTTEAFARVLEGAIGLPVLAGCAPIHYPPLPPASPTRWDFAFLGQMRPEKGSRILGEIVTRYLEARPQARVAIQCDTPSEPGEYLDGYGAIAAHPRIDWRIGPQDSATFADLLQGAGCILMPVEPARYQLRISGVFAEAVGAGRPVVVSSETWMSEMLRAGHGAGIAVRRNSPDVFVKALLQMREQHDRFESQARERSTDWRATQSLARLVSIIVREMAGA